MGKYKTTAHVTLHCLTGCMIGEAAGLIIGTALGWPPAARVALAVVLAFIAGIGLAAWQVMKREKLPLKASLQVVWLGEVISITVMEIAMNVTDYHVGGLSVDTLADPIFWWGLLAAGVAGYIAAYPVNWVLLSRSLKKCGHH